MDTTIEDIALLEVTLVSKSQCGQRLDHLGPQTTFYLHLHSQPTTCAKYEPPLGGGKEAREDLGLTRWSLFSMDDLKGENHLYECPRKSRKHER